MNISRRTPRTERRLTFDQIEGILGFALPGSARSRRSVYPLSLHIWRHRGNRWPQEQKDARFLEEYVQARYPDLGRRRRGDHERLDPRSCQNFAVKVAGRLLVNVIIGTCSVADARTYDGTHIVSGGLVETQIATRRELDVC